MIIYIDQKNPTNAQSFAQSIAQSIAARNAAFSSNKPREESSDYWDKNKLSDSSITILGHITNESGALTLGNQTAKKIAESLAARYGDNKVALTELFLVADWEIKVTNQGFSVSSLSRVSMKSTEFAQQLYNQMFLHGFRVKVNVCTVNSTGKATVKVTYSTDDVYLETLLAKNGILWRLLNAFGAQDITNLFDLDAQNRSIKNYEKYLLGNLELMKSNFNNPYTDKDLNYDNARLVLGYLNLGRNTDIETRDKAWSSLLKINTEDLDVNLKKYWENIGKTHQKLLDINDQKEGIKKNLSQIIGAYIAKHSNSNTHRSKCLVMSAIQQYLDNPSVNNWMKVTNIANNQTSPGWDKGFFSQVRGLKKQVESFHSLLNDPPKNS
jgi:hypothetical protein